MTDAKILSEKVRELLENGAGERAGDSRFLPLVTLESDARCGIDADLVWVIAPADGSAPKRCVPGQEHHFYEALETKRTDFDNNLEKAAAEAGLPADEIVLAFPAVAVVRAVLQKEHAYLTWLALQWIRPSELRELRAEIVKVTKLRDMPARTKELAERLIVPE